MPKVDAELYFVIDEKNNQIELTDKGFADIASYDGDKNFFVLPDIGVEIANIESQNLPIEEEAKLKEKLLQDFTVK